jgi:hypothetical protein
MKVSGFTFVRNALKYNYPVIEAITSVLPIVDEFIVAVGNSEDATLELIRSIRSDKIRIIETVWDDSLREGGKVLATETDKAFQAISPTSNWAIYIQADEVIHEKYHAEILRQMKEHLSNPSVEGLLFHYKHFYGSYNYVGESWSWYRREIRIVRNQKDIFSYRDAQGFRKKPNKKLNVKLINAYIYHYGWVRDPRAMQRKQRAFSSLYHDDSWVDEHVAKANEFDYSQVDSLGLFRETHPAVMKQRIEQKNWKFDFDVSKKNYSLKERLKRLVGIRIGEYKNYKII